MIFRQLFEQESSTYTYLIACEKTRNAALIDTVKAEVPQYLQLLRELNLTLVYALDTHTHADHITGAGELRDFGLCLDEAWHLKKRFSSAISHGRLDDIYAAAVAAGDYAVSFGSYATTADAARVVAALRPRPPTIRATRGFPLETKGRA